MPRTTIAAVQDLLGANYGPNPNGSLPNLQTYIDSATTLVDQLVTDASIKFPPYTHTSAQLELIERWLSAHFYTKMDPTYSSKSTSGASGSFVRDPKVPEPYKDAAIMLDPSGALAALLNRQTAGGAWLGKPVSAQIPYWERD